MGGRLTGMQQVRGIPPNATKEMFLTRPRSARNVLGLGVSVSTRYYLILWRRGLTRGRRVCGMRRRAVEEFRVYVGRASEQTEERSAKPTRCGSVFVGVGCTVVVAAEAKIRSNARVAGAICEEQRARGCKYIEAMVSLPDG